ncbi:DUF3558 domain-containing protein [Rhodococcus antarcticus]|uniref:DUF3558 domain-containing protein n=1 Tax=Rhodococcus antarcticus TaxID=2987751 RepID=A0ABY6P036_9NOCA|nr:DUF3558 domain-containing protein [Rhodococcus antarcticus]UZJ24976.1 DUF3558 domain-containing protein [Rhodococcus antarcticus]
MVLVPLVSSGCSATSTEGTAQSAPTSVTGSVADLSYDPCTQVTEAMVTSLGFDPSTKKPYKAGVGTATESGCAWKDSATLTRLGADLGKSLSTLDQYRNNPTFNGVTELTVGGHAAINFVTDRAGGGCNLAVEITGGTAIVATSAISRTSAPNPDSCPDAVRIATAIAPLFP